MAEASSAAAAHPPSSPEMQTLERNQNGAGFFQRDPTPFSSLIWVHPSLRVPAMSPLIGKISRDVRCDLGTDLSGEGAPLLGDGAGEGLRWGCQSLALAESAHFWFSLQNKQVFFFCFVFSALGVSDLPSASLAARSPPPLPPPPLPSPPPPPPAL